MRNRQWVHVLLAGVLAAGLAGCFGNSSAPTTTTGGLPVANTNTGNTNTTNTNNGGSNNNTVTQFQFYTPAKGYTGTKYVHDTGKSKATPRPATSGN